MFIIENKNIFDNHFSQGLLVCTVWLGQWPLQFKSDIFFFNSEIQSTFLYLQELDNQILYNERYTKMHYYELLCKYIDILHFQLIFFIDKLSLYFYTKNNIPSLYQIDNIHFLLDQVPILLEWCLI